MIGVLYRNILKPILFLFKADDVHSLFLRMGRFLGGIKIKKWLINKILSYQGPSLNSQVLGIDFRNPVGLAAGFDYDADLIEILPSVGFGYHTIGTVTYLPYEGNPRPMLGRLPKSKSLLVNKGFKSRGVEVVLEKIKGREKSIPLGISIGSTNQIYNSTNEMINDIVSSFQKVLENNYFDYFELNISCPNLINLNHLSDTFDSPLGLDMLLNKLSKVEINKPLFIKMYLEKSVKDTLTLAEVASKHSYVSGLIFSNLVKNRDNPNFDKEEIKKAGKGNFSGKPTKNLSNELISEVYKKYKDRFVIIGCGGIFSADDAYEKIRRGASLVQMITGMIYEGPQIIGQVNKGLVDLLEKDGYKNITEAIGSYYK
ncbi:MAG: quinone-dependent dihydroorotate dehydrogenase [Candidatus Pacebacteria bacterium]|nr:quinone-dependent dihydroorotate dehydrogenase [Candidatus Paceibacterota bacterium]